MAKFELSNEVKPLDRIISRLAGECGYEVQQVFNDLLRYIIHGFSPGAPPLKDWKYKRQQNMAFLEMTREWVGIMQRADCPVRLVRCIRGASHGLLFKKRAAVSRPVFHPGFHLRADGPMYKD